MIVYYLYREHEIKRLNILTLLAGIVFIGGTVMANNLKAVTPFSVKRYLGTWYEIARLPAWFEEGMTQVTATYTLKKNGTVKVENAGIRNGKPKKAIGKAKLSTDNNHGNLKVSFFLWFYADYTIIALDTLTYQYALVASSSKYLWILSRTPQLDKEIVDALVKKASEMGFDSSKLHFTLQGS